MTGLASPTWRGYRSHPGRAGAINGDSDTASTFDGTHDGEAGSTTTDRRAQHLHRWRRGSTPPRPAAARSSASAIALAGNSGSYDRHDLHGQRRPPHLRRLQQRYPTRSAPAGTYNDGQWHQVVGTLSRRGHGPLRRRQEGRQQPGHHRRPAVHGYWRIGGDNLAAGRRSPAATTSPAPSTTSRSTRPRCRSRRCRSTSSTAAGTLNIQPAPTDTYGKAVYADNPDLYWRLDDAGGPTANDAYAQRRRR